MDKHQFIDGCLQLLQTPELTEEMVANRAMRLIYSHQLVCYHDMVYRAETDAAENSLALLLSGHVEDISDGIFYDLDKEIFDTEKARILHKKELQDIADSWREYKDSLDSGLDAMLSMAGEVNKDQKLPVCTLEKNSHITVPRPFR